MTTLRDNEIIQNDTKIVVYSAHATTLERLAIFTLNILLYMIPVANLFFLYKNAKSYLRDGTSYGHRLMNMRVVSVETGVATLTKKALDRVVIWFVTVCIALGLAYGLREPAGEFIDSIFDLMVLATGAITLIFGFLITLSKNNQLPHDKITKTITVRTDNGRSQLFKAMLFTVIFFCTLGCIYYVLSISSVISENHNSDFTPPSFNILNLDEKYSDAAEQIEQANIIMSLLQDPNTGEYLASNSLPTEEIQAILGEVPEGLQWLDNRTDPFNYCIFVRSDTRYVFSTNSGTGELDSEPKELSDCK